MACRLFSTRPLFEPGVKYYQLDPKDHISTKYHLKFKSFHSRKRIWKKSSLNWHLSQPQRVKQVRYLLQVMKWVDPYWTMQMATHATRWKLDNKEGWKEFNKMVKKDRNKEIIEQVSYKEAINELKKELENTVGKRTMRTDKRQKANNPEIKSLRAEQKENKQKKNSMKHVRMCERPGKWENNKTEGLHRSTETDLKSNWQRRGKENTNQDNQNSRKGENWPKHNMEYKKKSTRMQKTRIQYHHISRRNNHECRRNKEPHYELFWGPISS